MNATYYNSARNRFARHLPRNPYCSDNPEKHGVFVEAKKNALRYPYIQLNQIMRCYLSFDVDYEGAAFAWEKADLQAPTIISVNPDNAHAHLSYELNAPVAFNGEDGTGSARAGPMKFFKAVWRSMCKKLDADRGYIGFILKNPLHKLWYNIFHDSACYDLTELAEAAPPI